MAEFYARTNEQLSDFIRSASAGDTIYLAAGTYDTVWIRNLGDLDIKIASLDESNPAIVTGLRLSGSSGVTFEGLIFEAGEGANNAFTVSGADDVHFSNVVVRGPDNIGSGEEVSPFMIRSSTNVSVTDSEFYHAKHALALLDVEGLVISGNSFHDIRCDGVRGGGVSDALITNNMFTDFSPWNTGGSGDHPDAIQLWSTAQDEPGRNITISDNLIYRGDGLPMQGIFIRDTYNNLPFENLTITGNVVLGGLYNGISVGGVIGGELTNNVVIAMDGQRSWIRVGSDTDFVIEDNVATRYSEYNRDTPYHESNLTIEGGTSFVEAALRAWTASGSNMLADLTGILVGDVRPDLIPNGDPTPVAEPVPVESVPAPEPVQDDPAPPPGGDDTATQPGHDQPAPEPSVMPPVTVIDIATPDVPTTETAPDAIRDYGFRGEGFGGFGDDVAVTLNLGLVSRFSNSHFGEPRGAGNGNSGSHAISVELHELFTLQTTHGMSSSGNFNFGNLAPAAPRSNDGGLVQDVHTAFEASDTAPAVSHSIVGDFVDNSAPFAPTLSFDRGGFADLTHMHVV